MAAVRVHAAISAGLAAGFALVTRSPWPVAGVLGAGVLIDGDHLIDLFWCRWRGKIDRVVLGLHGYEYAALLIWWASRKPTPVRLSIMAGYLGHLLLDASLNQPVSQLSYSVLYRALGGFRMDRFARPGDQPHEWIENGILRSL